MGVVRNENTLLNGIQTVQALTGNLPLLGMAVLKSALARKEKPWCTLAGGLSEEQ